MDQCKQIIAIGCMAFSGMKHRVHVIGLAGMELLPNNCALVDFCTMNMLIRVIGLRMLTVAKSIVSKINIKIKNDCENRTNCTILISFPHIFNLFQRYVMMMQMEMFHQENHVIAIGNVKVAIPVYNAARPCSYSIAVRFAALYHRPKIVTFQQLNNHQKVMYRRADHCQAVEMITVERIIIISDSSTRKMKMMALYRIYY